MGQLAAALAAVVGFFLFWIHQTVQSTQLSYQIRRLEGQIEKEEQRKVELNLLKDRHLSLSSVEQTAGGKLGLVLPEEKDLVLVPVRR